jgi:hypothetical protein
MIVDRAHEAGLEMIRVYPYWSDVEQKEANYNFEAVDAIYRRAEYHGIKVFHTFKPNSPPAYLRASTSFNKYDTTDIENPRIRGRLMEFVKVTVKRYVNSPVLHSWNVWNEPRIGIPDIFRPYDAEKFRVYLRNFYNNDINKLNDIYFCQYNNFEEIADQEAAFQPKEYMDYPEQMDLSRYNEDMLNRLIRDMSAVIRETDKARPIHVNSHNLRGNDTSQGDHIWGEAKEVDFLGASVYPAHDKFDSNTTLHGYTCDVLRSATPDTDMYYWITESQGGFAMYYPVRSYTPDFSMIKLWLWDSIGAGAKAFIYWSMNQAVRGEWSLLDFDYGQSERLRSVHEECSLLKRNEALFEKTKPIESEIWILQSDNSLRLDWLRGRDELYRGKEASSQASQGAWKLFSSLGYEVGFIGEERIRNRKLPEGSTLICPACSALDEKTMEAISTWVRRGGTLIGDGQFAFYNQHGLVSEENKKLADELFGSSLLDFKSSEDEILLGSSLGDEIPVLKLMAVFKENDAVTHHFKNGEPGILKHKMGSGKAMYIGTQFFVLCFQEEIICPEAIKNFIEAPKSTFVLEKGTSALRLRILQGETPVLTLVNYGPACSVVIRTTENVLLKDLKSGECYQMSCGKINVPVLDKTARIFKVMTQNN